MRPKLSICIPTYNRAAFIGKTLESIVEQAGEDVEIVISDNASQDNTEEVVKQFLSTFPKITYFRWEENMGADRNFLKVVEIAKGDFCWLMGSDDKVEKNAIDYILQNIDLYPNLSGLSVNSTNYDYSLVNKLPKSPIMISATELHNDFLFTDASECFAKLGSHFGYLSGQIVNRELWGSIVQTENLKEYFNAYVHVYIIGQMLIKSPRWLYLHTPCVGWRSGNDSFLSEGQLRRLEIDVVGYEKIAKDLFGKGSYAYNSLLKRVSTTYIWHAILGAKLNNMSHKFYSEAFKMCFAKYKQFPEFWYKTVPLFLMPSFILRGARLVYRYIWLKK